MIPTPSTVHSSPNIVENDENTSNITEPSISVPSTTTAQASQQTSNSFIDSLEFLLRTALFSDVSNNTTPGLTRFLQSSNDPARVPIFSFEFPIDYEEYYDLSNNLIRRELL